MPVYQLGDLVRFNSLADDLGAPTDDAVGFIIEMRNTGPYAGLRAHILWSDTLAPEWHFISNLVPMQPDGDRGITG